MARTLTRTARRWIAALMLAVFGWAQLSVAMAACDMERGELGAMLSAEADAVPCDCGTMAELDAPPNVNHCVAHCTTDLRMAAFTAAIVRAPAEAPVLALRTPAFPDHRRHAGLDAPPPGTPPARVLLHAYLI